MDSSKARRATGSRSWGAGRVALFGLLVLALATLYVWAAPAIGTVQLSPTSIVPGLPTRVRITAEITDPGVIPSTVNLQRLNDAGAAVAVIGLLNDGGVNGDAVAGDHVYTLEASFTETAPLRLRVSAGFRGLLRRVLSAEMLLNLNRPPSADAGPNRSVAVGAEVAADGRRSSDPDGNPISFHWTIKQRPGASVAELNRADAVQSVFIADEPGDYLLELVVSDGHLSSPPALVQVQASAPDTPPTADAGPDQDVPLNTRVRLDGRASHDPDAATLSYQWHISARPAQSQAQLDDAGSAQPSFTADVAGEYRLRLQVSDGRSSAEDEVVVTARAGNTPPTAMPGDDQSVAAGTRVALDGTASFDPDPGDALAGDVWTFIARPAGSQASFEARAPGPAGALQAAFTPDRDGDYLIELVVTDSHGARSAPRRLLVQAGVASTLKPVLLRLLPDQAAAGSGPVTVVAEGARIAPGASLVFGGSLLTARVISAGRLEASIPASLLAVPGSVSVLVRNPPARGGDSNSRSFVVSRGTPLLQAVSPSQLQVGRGETLAVAGANFTPASQVKFGSVLLPTSYGGSTMLNAAVAAALLSTPGQVPVMVVDPVNGSSNALTVNVVPAPLAISGISPTEGPPGTRLTIDGSGFVQAPGGNQVSVGNVAAGVLAASPNQISATVSLAADTGPVKVSTPYGSVTGPVFTVRREQDFNLVASPASVPVYAGSGASVMLQVGSIGPKPFTGIAMLGAGALPAGISATFSPVALAAGQTGAVLLTAAGTVAAGSHVIVLQATAVIDGASVTRNSQVTLVVRDAAAVAGVRGRFVDDQGRGLAGVSVRAEKPNEGGSNLGQVVSDAAGNFLLGGLPTGDLTLRIDATPVGPGYPIWPQSVWIEAGKVTRLPDWTVRPRPADERFTPLIANHSQDQVITNPEVPGLSMRIPAGVTVQGWDGVVRTRAAINRVAPDKLPTGAPLGGAKSYYQISFGASMGGLPVGGPAMVAVTAPNDLGLEPGDKAELYYYHGIPTAGPGGWKKAGAGTVSADGKTVSTDPGVGIDRFCGVCGFHCWIAPAGIPNECSDCQSPSPPKATNKPVSLVTGLESGRSVDMVIDGVMPIVIGRVYHPWDTFIRSNALLASLGHGWSFSYDHLIYTDPFTGALKYVFPGNSRVTMTSDSSGAYVALDDLRLGGARLVAGGVGWTLHFKDGRRWLFTGGSSFAMLTDQIDAQGNRLTIHRGANNRPTTITAPGRSVSIGHNGAGFIDTVRDELGRTVEYGYSGDRMETVRAPDGAVTRYGYFHPPQPVGLMASAGAAGAGGGGGGGQMAMSSAIGPYTAQNGPVYIADITYPAGAPSVSMTYSANHRVVRQTMSGTELRIAYELSGACALRAAPSYGGVQTCAGSDGPQEDSYENHVNGWRFFGGQVIASTVTDGNGNRYKVKFNSAGFGTEMIDALGQVTTYQRDPRHRITAVTDPLGRTVRYEYDANSNRTAVIDPAGRRTDIAYHPQWNKPVSVTRRLDGGAAVTYTFQYAEGVDTDGRLLSATDPLGHVTRYDYTGTATGRALVAKVTDPLGHATTLAYSDRSDLVGVSDALGNQVDFARDVVGRLAGVTDALGATTRSEYNAIDQIVRIVDANNGVTQFQYDEKRDPSKVIDALGHAVESYSTDALHRLRARVDAVAGEENYSYDAASRLVRVVDRKGQSTTLSYDALDRLTGISRADGNHERRSYDAVGRVTRVEDGVGITQFDYDLLDRVVKETTDVNGVVASVEYAYDALDRRVRRSVVGADATTYSYDRASRLVSIGFRGLTVGYEWDAAGRLLAKTLTNGIRQEYVHDVANRLTDIRYRRSDSSLIDSINYEYDANGRRIGRTMGFLTNVETPIQGTYDIANRMTNVTFPGTGETCAMSYDRNGSLAAKVCPAGTTTYTWDARDRLMAISGPGVTASFKYDAFGRRVERVVNGVVLRYLYDGVQAIAEFGGAGGDAALLTGLAVDEVLGRFAGSGDRVMLTDALGSVVAESLLNESVVTSIGYSAFGESTISGSPTDSSTRYTGREEDKSGLTFNRARYLDPALKRFLNEDAIRIASGVNFYSYAMNSPFMYTDRFGLSAADFEISVSNDTTSSHLSTGQDDISMILTEVADIVRTHPEYMRKKREREAAFSKDTTICSLDSPWHLYQIARNEEALRFASIYYATSILPSQLLRAVTKRNNPNNPSTVGDKQVNLWGKLRWALMDWHRESVTNALDGCNNECGQCGCRH